MTEYDVIVIGGGASGMMAAYVSAFCGAKTLLLESNDKLGKKLYITGKGRCNVTNDSPVRVHIDNVVHGAKFLQSAYANFNAQNMMEFLSSRGLELKVERGNRVFPISDKSSDVIKCLEKAVRTSQVDIHLGEAVIDVEHQDELPNSYTVCTSMSKYSSCSVIVATGGSTYTSTGSTGFGYKLAKKFGHNITNISPALVPIILKDNVEDLEGLSLKNVEINYCKYRFMGEMLFTNNGISGPIVLSLSSFLSQEKIAGKVASLDFKPALTIQQLLDRFNRDFSSKEFSKKMLASYLKSLLPIRFVPYFAKKLSFSNKNLSVLNKQERVELAQLLKSFPLTLDRLDDLEYGIVTSGGVDLKEINPKTMESKLSSGLYFAGEVIDADALTGGFNLQIAFSTGVLAGESAARRNK